MMVSEVGRITYGSSSSLPPAIVTTASSGAKPSTCSASFFQKALRNQQRKIDVLMAGCLEAVIELPLQHLPDRIAIGLDDHAAFDDLGRLGHVALQNDVLIPGGEIALTRCNRRLCHKLFSILNGSFAAARGALQHLRSP